MQLVKIFNEKSKKGLLKKENIFMIDETEVSKSQSEYIADYFIQNVSPAMVVIMIGELKRFPSLKDNAAYLAIKMEMAKGDTSFASKNMFSLKRSKFNLQSYLPTPNRKNHFEVGSSIRHREYVPKRRMST